MRHPKDEPTVMSLGDANTEQLWKTRDRLAQKEGPRSNVYFVTGEVYKGEWKENKKDGKGTLQYRNGDKYEGEWKSGKRDGQGTLWIHIGNGKYTVEYSGGWKEGKMHGFGILYNEYGEKYDGFFENGKRHGKGRQMYGGRPIDGFGADVYNGEWIRGLRDGYGVLQLANGDRYEGKWAQDLKSGAGTFYYAQQGKKYEGVWKEDIARCGAYSSYDSGVTEALPLPVLQMAEPDQVLKVRRVEVASASC